MNSQRTMKKACRNTAFAAATLCLSVMNVQAADIHAAPLHLLDNDSYKTSHPASSEVNRIHPGTPLILAPVSGAFEFDLAGSEIPKLQLQLAQPLQLQGSPLSRTLGRADVLGMDATLALPLGQGFSVQTRAEQSTTYSQYQALGSIQCMNGTLKPDSYTASGCRFVNESSPSFDRRTLNIGASKEIGAVSSSINWFTSRSSQGQRGISPSSPLAAAPLLDPLSIAASGQNSLLPGIANSPFAESEASGVDLNFQVGFTTDRSGEVQLGLALTRVYDASLNGLNGETFTPLAWNEAAPFNSAALGIEWQKGSFSGGVRGYYREQVDFLGRQSLDSIGTFDVHFTWRAPWNANFSVGASNVLGAGVEDLNAADKPVSNDRFESIYGRIPYVRYQQDL